MTFFTQGVLPRKFPKAFGMFIRIFPENLRKNEQLEITKIFNFE